jgi:hypothetical protein
LVQALQLSRPTDLTHQHQPLHGTLAGMNFYVEGIEGDIPQ